MLQGRAWLKILKIVELEYRDRYKACIAHVTSNTDFPGAKIAVRPPPGALIKSAYPSWPCFFSEEELVWLAKTYTRRFPCETLYSFGVRLEIEGKPPFPRAKLFRWEIKGEEEFTHIFFDIELPIEFSLTIGPFKKLVKAELEQGLVNAMKSGFIQASSLHGRLAGAATAVFQPYAITGSVEAKLNDEQLPFMVKLYGLGNASVDYRVLIRLPDLCPF